MIYLTYADPPSGVFSSQVNDVCNYLNKSLDANIRLVAFISLHDFKKNKAKIKKEVPKAIVLPMLPKANYWKFSISVFLFVCLLLREKIVIARGVLACNVALGVKKTGIIKKLCYDGRGAIAAEWEEYKVAPYKNLIHSIKTLEKNAVLKTDFRISISTKLIEYWNESFGYKSSAHVIIPCTLNSDFKGEVPSIDKIKKNREDAGFAADDLILVYSGSVSGWQSFGILQEFLSPFLKENKSNKILFMSGEDANIQKMISEFPQQVSCKWTDHKDVQKVLSMCDYGILIREKSITNKVASPVKFAEYLSAGLKILISEGIGDYTSFVKENNCGQVIKDGEKIKTEKSRSTEKQRMIELVTKYFTKSSQKENYKNLIGNLK
ncbi:MAG: hypothetical protein ABI855_05050 [Bacteroidota bacterium]